MEKFIIAAIPLFLLIGCAPKHSLYQQWGNLLAEKGSTKEDISLILGSEPSRCEQVASPKPVIGIFFEKNQLKIKSVRPNSPADRAGLTPGDVIIKINDQPVRNEEDIKKMRQGISIQIETNRGIATVTPDVPETEQCYWEIKAGQISSSRSGAYFNGYGGVSNSGSEAYQRFFRASCRFQNGFSVGCQSNWQG